MNELLLIKEQEYFEEKSKADIRTNYYMDGKNRKLKIWNNGQGEARNLTLCLDEIDENWLKF